MNTVYGFGRISRFIIRRERVISTVWILCLAGSAVLFAALYPGLLPTKEEMLIMAQTMNTPAMIAMMGPVYGLDALTTAIVMSQECLLWFIVAAGVMNIFFINRYTRGDEELGRLEMFRSLPVGRLTNAVSALACAFVLNLTITCLTAAGLMALNIDGTTAAGAFAYGAAIGAGGFLFAGLTLLTAQMFSTSRGALGVSFAALGLFYAARASGDMADNALSYLSPLGLSLRVYAFYENNFWPVAVLLAETVLLTVVALALCTKRDMGEGIIPARSGKKEASRFLKSPLGLAWRLMRNTLIAWSVTALVLGAMYASVIGELDTFVNSNDMIKKMLEAAGAGNSMIDSFVAMIFSIMALLAAVPVINAAMKIQSEEKRGRMEQVYARSVSRIKMFGGYIFIALIQSVVFMLLLSLGLYGAGMSSGLLELDALLKAGLVYLPALWTVIGLSVFLVGWVPKLTPLIWVLFAYSFLMAYFGRLLDLPEWCAKITPFGHVPSLPVQELTIWPLIILTVLGAALTVLGLAGYRKRDIG